MDNQTAKLVLAGPVGAGKTTAIGSIADSAPISTEMPLTDGPMGEKTTTTVAFDFATVMLDDGTPLFVYGLPGQEHFSFMRTQVVSGAVRVIIVLDGADPRLALECVHWLKAVREAAGAIPVVLGITKSETVPNFGLRAVREAIRSAGKPIPVFTFDARDRQQTSNLVRALLLSIE